VDHKRTSLYYVLTKYLPLDHIRSDATDVPWETRYFLGRRLISGNFERSVFNHFKGSFVTRMSGAANYASVATVSYHNRWMTNRLAVYRGIYRCDGTSQTAIYRSYRYTVQHCFGRCKQDCYYVSRIYILIKLFTADVILNYYT